MIGLSTRLKMALSAFRCKPFEIIVEPYHEHGELRPGSHCDHYDIGCKNSAVLCMSQTTAELKFKEDDHEHLCLGCARKIKGKY